ncbi:MAG: protein kinase [Myxococcota bacterium]
MKIGDYELRHQLNQGGMAQVWLAQRVWSDGKKKVAVIKMPRTSVMVDPRQMQMFLDEARLAMQLEHDNIVSVFDAGIHKGLPWIAMSYVPGRNVAELLRAVAQGANEFDFDVAAHVTRELGYALQYAHEYRCEGVAQNIVHRDVAAKNVMISGSGGVQLTDFGVASAVSIQSTSTHVKGTFRYMAREHALGHANAKSDAFGMGTVLWSLLEGKDFRWDIEQAGLINAAIDGYITPLTRQGVPPTLLQILHGLLEPDERRRMPIPRAVELLEAFPGRRTVLKKMLARYFGVEVLRSGHTSVGFKSSEELERAMKVVQITGEDSSPPPYSSAKSGLRESDTRKTRGAVDASAPAASRGAVPGQRTLVVPRLAVVDRAPEITATEQLPLGGRPMHADPPLDAGARMPGGGRPGAGVEADAQPPVQRPTPDTTLAPEPSPVGQDDSGTTHFATEPPMVDEPTEDTLRSPRGSAYGARPAVAMASIHSPTDERVVSASIRTSTSRSGIAAAMLVLALVLALSSVAGVMWLVLRDDSVVASESQREVPVPADAKVEVAEVVEVAEPAHQPEPKPRRRFVEDDTAASVSAANAASSGLVGSGANHTDVERPTAHREPPMPSFAAPVHVSSRAEPRPAAPAAKVTSPVSSSKARPRVSVRIALGFVPHAQIRLGRRTHTLTRKDEANLTVSAGRRTLRWRLMPTEPWRMKTIDFEEGHEHFILIESSGPKSSSTKANGERP